MELHTIYQMKYCVKFVATEWNPLEKHGSLTFAARRNLEHWKMFTLSVPIHVSFMCLTKEISCIVRCLSREILNWTKKLLEDLREMSAELLECIELADTILCERVGKRHRSESKSPPSNHSFYKQRKWSDYWGRRRTSRFKENTTIFFYILIQHSKPVPL